MRRAAKVDSNHGLIVAALRKAGCHVEHTYMVGNGFPDLLVWSPFTKQPELLEVKKPLGPKGGKSDSALTEDEVRWHESWPGRVHVVRSPEQALRAVGCRQ